MDHGGGSAAAARWSKVCGGCGYARLPCWLILAARWRFGVAQSWYAGGLVNCADPPGETGDWPPLEEFWKSSGYDLDQRALDPVHG